MKIFISLLFALVLGFIIGGTIGHPLEFSAAFGVIDLGFQIFALVKGLKADNILALGVCGRIAMSVGLNCDNPIQAGVEDRIWIINFDDYKNGAVTPDATNKMIVTDIALPTGKQAYYFDGKLNSHRPTSALAKQTYANNEDHQIIFLIFDKSPEVTEQLQNMKDGKYVVIYETSNRGVDGSSAFRILGAGRGLDMLNLTEDPLSADNQGAWEVTLGSPANIKEAKLPLHFFDTDYDTTKAAVVALLTPAV